MPGKQAEIIFPTHDKENNHESEQRLYANRAHFSKQCEKVYGLLRSGIKLTVKSAMNDWNIMSLPRRILDLKQRGIDVQSRFIDGTNIKEYYISSTNDNESNVALS